MRHVGELTSDVFDVVGMKPIPTQYNGILYRSRTEARWAVFFDVAGIEFGYEVEAFEFDSERYLPDFWLPQLDAFLEVKPDTIMPGTLEWDVAEMLSLASGRRVFVTSGFPWSETGLMVFKRIGNDACMADSQYEFCVCPKCNALGVEFQGRHNRVCGERCFPGEDRGFWKSTKLDEAKVASRQARFWK